MTRSDGRLDRPHDSSSLGTVRLGLLDRYRWLPFVLPLAVYMLLGTLEPGLVVETGEAGESVSSAQGNREPGTPESDSSSLLPHSYPLMYAIRIGVTAGAILFVLPVYRQFPLRISGWSIAAGMAGVVLWVGICRLELEQQLLSPLGLGPFLGLGERSAFDPFEHLGSRPGWLVFFLGVRFVGLAAVVPLIEEFFLRGFLMRFVADPKWWELRIGEPNTAAIVTATVYGMLSHPAELFAAAVWFSLITWLMIKTRNIWDCVAAHAVTNLLLGVYVVTFRDWELW